MSNQWERLGNAQKAAYPQYMPGAINNRIPFMLAKDATQNMPKNPTGWVTEANNVIESARVQGIDLLAEAIKYGPLTGAAIGSFAGPVGMGVGATIGTVPLVFSKIDQATDGSFSKLLMAGAGNVRSNYAFARDLGSKNAALGILSGLFTVSGAVLGGAAGFVGTGFNPLGAAAGAGLGAAAAGKFQREVTQTDFVKRVANELYRSSKFAEQDVGQESYNFGRDVVRFASDVTGVKTLGDTSKGIGAITSGIFNFGFEVGLGPDIALFKGVGAVARPALIGASVVPERTGLFAKVLNKKTAIEAAKRAEADIDLIKRTVAGEETSYTPVFKFYKENPASVVMGRPEFRSDMGQIAAHLVAGADDETIGLVLRVGRYDQEAIDLLGQKSASKLAEYNRIDDAISVAESGGQTFVVYNGQILTASKTIPNTLDFLKKEVASLKKESDFWTIADDSLKGSMTDRTVSPYPWVERLRNDLTKERAARKFELSKAGVFSTKRITDDLTRETRFGGVIQGIYQRSPFSVPIRWVDRATDDAPRDTINFNDVIIASDRMRANIRGATRYAGVDPKVGLALYDEFINATDEITKYNIVNKYTDTLAKSLATKYDLPVSLVDEILKAWDESHKAVLLEAKTASIEGRTYMIGKNLEPIEDPQLISQLANGAYLPNPKEWDKAFARYKKKYGAEASIPLKAGMTSKYIIDEFGSLWRAFTLLRAGYPINIIRDSSVRMLGDGALFPVLKILSEDAFQAITNTSNTKRNVKSATTTPKASENLARIRNDIYVRDETINVLQRLLDEADVKYTKSKTGIKTTKPTTQLSPEVQRSVIYLNDLMATVNALRIQEVAIVSGAPAVKRISKDKIILAGYDFPAARSGSRFADISMQQLRQREDLRRALASIRELEVSNLRRSRTGSRTIEPRENEQLHLISWQNILKDEIGNDAVARIIMTPGTTFTNVSTFLRNTPEGQQYLSRMGLRPSDARLIYDRVTETLKQFAPTRALHKMILEDGVSIDALRKLYPDIDTRPLILTDLVKDMLGTSNAYLAGTKLFRQGVEWLSTAPTSKLMYAPYFAFKYEQKLQNLIFLATKEGRKLTLRDKEQFERLARQYGIAEYRNKLNAFHRDMNYNGIVNYLIAFFPAVVEQFRAYGRIFLEHPDFLPKAIAVKQIPERVFSAEEDAYGQESIEVELPILGLTARIPSEWFNVFNPTGSSLLGAGPVAAAGWNEYVNRFGGEDKVTEQVTKWVLPFGVQANSANALLPNTVRRLSQLIVAATGKNGPQFNRDVNMFLKQLNVDFLKGNGRGPTALELEDLSDEAKKDALLLSTVRFLSSLTLGAQPRYVTALQPYADELARMRKEDPINGEEEFINQNPDLFLLADSLSEATSGLRSDDTAVALVKKNPEMVSDLVAIIGDDNLPLLGAIFNDDDYAFSSKAQAYLERNAIPNTAKKFRDTAAAFDSARGSYVSQGWNEWNRFITAIEDEVRNGIDGEDAYNPNRGYGKSIVDYYKKDFLEQLKVKNPIWFQEYDSYSGGGGAGRQARLVDALSYAINDDNMWKSLSKNPRWIAVAEYLNFRYDVNSQLKQMGTTIDSSRALFIREDVAEFVDGLKRKDPMFSKFYERYFSNDKFDHVYGG
jgi:hypothetical protein